MANQESLYESETDQVADAATLMTPFGIDSDGRLTHAIDARRENGYFCPACGQKLILKRGKIKTPHFAHKPESKCSGETIKHQVGKLRIADAIANWKVGITEAPKIGMGCQHEWCDEIKWLPIPDKVSEAILELPIGVHRVDVALMNGETPIAAIEVKVSHAVDNTKAKQLHIPFIEVDADAVIENPMTLRPIRDTLKRHTCAKCTDTLARFDALAKELLKPAGLETLPTKYYRYGPHQCWKCKKRILVFAWSQDDWSTKKPSMRPIPRTLQCRYSSTARHEYWTNVCHNCDSIQGDWFLRSEPEGVFFGLEEFKNFESDIARIAHWALEGGYCSF